MTEAKKIQKADTIYAGDFQTRTPQDQGPVQNAALDKGIVTVAIRSLYSDSSSPAFVGELILDTYKRIPDPENFRGIVGMGDYLDMGCKQELEMVRIPMRKLEAADPRLKFVLLTPGNHDGGQFMGTLWSTKNELITGLLYKDFILDNLTGTCGEAKNIEPRSDSVRDFEGIVRNGPDTTDYPIQNLETHVKHGSRHGFKTKDNSHLRFKKQPDSIFSSLWRVTPAGDHWDCVVHYDSSIFGKHIDKEDLLAKSTVAGPFDKLKEFANTRGDVKQWIQLQAQKEVTFTASNGVTVPVYEVALDTMDFTSSTDFSGAIFGHISEFQISIVENFIDTKLKENPNSKFKLIMHYPIGELVACARHAFKRLLSRDEIVLVVDAHVHERGFDSDMRDDYHLKRATPLPHITIPATADVPREDVLEEMTFTDDGTVDGKRGRLDFHFSFEGLDERKVSGADENVFSALTKFEADVLAQKYKNQPNMAHTFSYINEDEVIAQYDKHLQRIANRGRGEYASSLKVLNSPAQGKIQFKEILRMIFRLWGRASEKLVAEASNLEMETDFPYFLMYLRQLNELLDSQYPELAIELGTRIEKMNATFEVWKKSYDRRTEQKYPDSARKIMNSLYTDTDLNEMYRFLNEDIPDGSRAKAFLIIAGMRAGQEEEKYHNATEPNIPNTTDAAVEFTLR